MTSELDIYRAAAVIVREHGDDAPIVAAMRADELLAAGDMAVAAVWKRILTAVDVLLRTDPADAEAVH